jgi:oligopeptide/dipeptide ABC transporter ATP-binding protein
MEDLIIDINGLSVYFRTDKKPLEVVSGVSFNIKRSEVFGLVGESGCGKTLTALSILGILPHNAYAEGNITFQDKNLLRLDKEDIRQIRGKDISIIFQEPMTSLNPVMKIGKQIAESLMTHFDISKNDAMERSVELLRAVKIPDPEIRIKDYPHQLSGGMRQRVMIAMAIACDPSLLIADEPTTALDVTIQAQILELLQMIRQQRQMAILLITHDLSIISEQAKRCAIMYAGRILEIAETEEIFRKPLHPYTIGLLESLPSTRGVPLKPIRGFVPSPENLPSGCKFYDRCFMCKDICNLQEPELVEVSKNHFVRCIGI